MYIFILLYCIVLYWWCGHCCAMHCDVFKIYCALPNLGIRTWICRLNVAQRPIFSGLTFFNEPEISDSGPPAWSLSRRTCAQDFYVLKKSINLSRVYIREPWISRRARYSETTEADIIVDSWHENLHIWYRDFVIIYFSDNINLGSNLQTSGRCIYFVAT